MKKIALLSLFSGCGGMDIGFEGDFLCLRKSINSIIHPTWISEKIGDWVRVAPTIFRTVFANDIIESAKVAYCKYFRDKKTAVVILFITLVVSSTL
jgi:DNA (cytosine-5)-methyltransferase 1